MCHSEDCADEESNSEESSQLLLAISMAASAGTVSAHSIQFLGAVQGHPARILVDSGSTHTFVSSDLARQLSGMSSFNPSLHVTVADGMQLLCSSHFLNLQ